MNPIFPSILAFGIPNGPELWIIIFLIFLLFGAKRLPTLARSIGKSIHEFRRAKDEFQDEMEKAGKDIELEADRKRTAPPAEASAPSDTYPRQS